jgi:hypothetical protein
VFLNLMMPVLLIDELYGTEIRYRDDTSPYVTVPYVLSLYNKSPSNLYFPTFSRPRTFHP